MVLRIPRISVLIFNLSLKCVGMNSFNQLVYEAAPFICSTFVKNFKNYKIYCFYPYQKLSSLQSNLKHH